MGLEEPKSRKILRIVSYILTLGVMLTFFIFLSTNWQWMVQNNGLLFTLGMTTLATAITIANFAHMFHFNPFSWIRNRKK